MGKKHEPYSDFCTERLIEKTEEEKLAEALDEIIKNDPEHAAEIIAKRLEGYLKREKKAAKRERKKTEDNLREERLSAEEANRRAEEASREKRALEKEYRKRKNRSILISAWLGLVVVFTLIFEFIFPLWGIAIALVICGMFAEILKIFFDSFFNSPNPAADSSGEEPCGMAENLRCFFGSLKKKGVLQITAFGVSVCLAAGVMANLKVCTGIALFCKGGSIMLANTGGFDGKNHEEIQPQQEETGSAIPYETKQYLTGADEELIRQLNKTRVSRRDLDMLLNLSPEDYDAIFFYGGSGIGEGLTQEQMNKRILDRVRELLEKKLENEFDRSAEEGGPSQSVRDEISRVSDREEAATDFSEIKEILSYREGINESYPKRTLTQLVSNGYHHLALLLYWYGGEETTIAYYYGQSILYGLKCLEYADNTGLTVKEKLLFIAQRYEDITYTCPGFRDMQRAGMLAEAFRYAADRY